MKHLLFFSLALAFCAATALADSGRITIANNTGEPFTIIEDVDAAAYQVQANDGKVFDLGNTTTVTTTSSSQPISKSFVVKLQKSKKKINLQVKIEGSKLKYGIEGKMYDTLTPISDDYKKYELQKVGDLFVYVFPYRDQYRKGYHDIAFDIRDKEVPSDVLQRMTS